MVLYGWAGRLEEVEMKREGVLHGWTGRPLGHALLCPQFSEEMKFQRFSSLVSLVAVHLPSNMQGSGSYHYHRTR